MRILLITDEVWNDKIHGNNVLSNWFTDFPAEFANIYCSSGLPDNKCCDKYFQITDKMMLNSILKRSKAGRTVEKSTENVSYSSTDIGHLSFLKRYFGNLLRLFKNIVWSMGRYDEKKLESFIKEFDPDIIFCPRFATLKLLRLERIVKKYTNSPMVAFTGDNEYSLRMFSFSPVAWLNKFLLRSKLKRQMRLYSLYYTLSDEQKAEYERCFDIPVKILRKCSDFDDCAIKSEIGNPIRMVYAGKLYCNRWKTLASIGEALKDINKNGKKIILDIYTKDKLTEKQKKAFDCGGFLTVHDPIPQEEVFKEYSKSDIALHIESFDLKYKLATRVSFSTKIIDCLASGCAVMAIAWGEHSGLTYLKRENAAICIEDLNDIKQKLIELTENPKKIVDYKIKARDCLKNNHNKSDTQDKMYQDFIEVIQNH